MKTRHGFVSNSSSSSFVVAIPKGESTEIELTLTVDLARYGTSISTIEELNQQFIDDHGWIVRKDGEHTIEEVLDASDDEGYDYRKGYNEFKALIDAGKTIISGSFCDDSGEAEETYLCCNGINNAIKKGSGIEIIQGEGRY